jgi:hypothetical protein
MPPRRCSERSRAAREKNDTTTAPLAKLRNDPLPTPAEALLEPFSAFASWFMHIAFPEKGCRVGLHIVLFEGCSAFNRVAACTLARPPIRGPLYRRLQPLRHLHDCSGCFRLERVAGWAFHPLERAAFHGAHPERTFPGLGNSVGKRAGDGPRLTDQSSGRFSVASTRWSSRSRRAGLAAGPRRKRTWMIGR